MRASSVDPRLMRGENKEEEKKRFKRGCRRGIELDDETRSQKKKTKRRRSARSWSSLTLCIRFLALFSLSLLLFVVVVFGLMLL